MALSLRTQWEVRPGGSSLNSGGFNSSNVNAGTDLSQSLTATLRTDMVIGAANSISSAATPFTASELGNLIHVTAGVNWTPGWYELVSLVGAVVTLDRSPGTLAASGGTGRVGGALSTPNDTPALQGGTVWLQGSFTTAGQYILSDGVGDGNFVVYAGYGTVRGDNGLATITASANLSPIVTQANQIIVRNLKIDGANLADRGMNMGIDTYVENVWVTRCNLSGILAQNEGSRLQRCLFSFNGAGAAAGVGLDVGTGVVARACEAHHNKMGFSSSNASGHCEYCVSHDNTASGFYQGGDDGMRLRNCIADANAVDGLQINDSGGATTMEVTNCHFTNNGGKGVRSVATNYGVATAAAMAAFFQNNRFYNNTGGNYSQLPAGADDVLLTADPYTSRATGDYSLNGAAGGGAACRGTGIPGGIGLLGAAALASTSYLDSGAVQGLAAAAPTTAYQTMLTMWREMTGEHDDATILDSIAAFWIDAGLEALNRRIRYHWTTDPTSIVLLAGVQEYTLPADLVELRWVQWNGRELVKGDPEEWRRRLDEWRNEPAGEPLQWAIYANKLIIRPTPSAEAVAVAASPVFRYCSKPPAVATGGADMLNSQDYRVPVLYGASAYCGSYPDSAVAQQRAATLMKAFDDEIGVIAQDYGDRMLRR